MTVMDGAPPSGLGVITLDTAVVLGLNFCNHRDIEEGRKEGRKETSKQGPTGVTMASEKMALKK